MSLASGCVFTEPCVLKWEVPLGLCLVGLGQAHPGSQVKVSDQQEMPLQSRGRHEWEENNPSKRARRALTLTGEVIVRV